MALIKDVLDNIDEVVTSLLGEGQFVEMAVMIYPVFVAMSILLIVIIGINLMVQFQAMSMMAGFSIILRIGIINVFAFNWDNFDAVYNILTNAPEDMGGLILNKLGIGNEEGLYTGLDAIFESTKTVGTAVTENGGMIAGAFAGLFLFFITSLMATAAIIVLGLAKIMLAILLIIAPVAIVLSMFKQTASIFEAWLKLAIGYSLIPMLVGIMIGVILVVSEGLGSNVASSDVDTLGDVVSFIVISMVGTGLILMVPNIASGMAQTALSIGGVAAGATSGASSAARSAASAAGKLGAKATAAASASMTPAKIAASLQSNTAGINAAAQTARKHL